MKGLKGLLLLILLLLSFAAYSGSAANSQQDLALPQERHLRNVKQLTFGGENADLEDHAGR